jgi:hypothetical protein
MSLSRFFGRQNARSTRRPLVGRRHQIEALEGRQLLSTFTQTELGLPPAKSAIVGQHIGTSMIQGNHIGTNAIQGNHIGVSMRQGAHIDIVGQHIGFEAVSPNGVVARKH